MSACGAKRKKERVRRSSFDSSASSKRSKKTRAAKISEGEHVCWAFDGGYKEGTVIFDDGVEMQVATENGYPKIFSSAVRQQVSAANWRKKVKPGDVLDLSFDRRWIPCKVRGVQIVPARPHVLVVEPVFVGYCVSAPLNSLIFRKPPTPHPDMVVLQQSGFAFNDAHNQDAPHNWPPYKPNGCMNLRHVGPAAQARVHDNGDTYYELICNPVVPSNLKMVRTPDGVLKFVLETELGTVDARSKLRIPEEARLGQVTVAYACDQIAASDKGQPLNVFLDAAKLARVYYDKGNFRQAAKCLMNRPSNITWRGESEPLAEALLDTVSLDNKHQFCHPLSRIVWQHRYTDLSPYGCDTDLNTLSESLDDLSDYSPEHNALKNHICIWQMYENLWNLARGFQHAAESYKPVEVAMASIDANQIVFDVNVMVTGQNAFVDKRHFGRNTRIMEAFSQEESSSSSTSNLFHSTNDWNSAVWSCFGGSGGNLSTAQRMFERENCAERNTLYNTVMKTVVCKSEYGGAYRVLRWNALEGPVQVQTFDSEDDYHMSRGAWRPRALTGGVLLQQSSVDKMHTIADLISLDKTSRDLGFTIIVTKPTLLTEWKRILEDRGVPAYLYHGSRRCSVDTTRAIKAKHVILTTGFCISNARDKWFLHRSLSGDDRVFLKRIVLDNLICRKTIPGAVFDATHSFSPRSVWLLEREATKNIFGTALALLRVRPFFKLAGWETDLHSELCTRQYARLLLFSKSEETYAMRGCSPGVLKDLQQLRHNLVKGVFVCGENTINQQFVSVVRHGETHMEPALQRLLVLIRGKQSKGVLSTQAGTLGTQTVHSHKAFSNLFASITGIYYGMQPKSVSHYCSRMATGSYDLDCNSFLKRMKSNPNTVSNQKAVEDVQKLAAKNPIDATCPICMESISGTSNEKEDGISLNACVAYGVCGHALCGECADSIQRVALENLVSQTNDYGYGDNSINRPRCPICRHPWDTGQPPLISSTNKHYRLESDHSGLYACPEFWISDQNPAEAPGVKTLFQILQQLGSKKIVVVCQTTGLAEFLCKMANGGNKRTKAVFLSPQKSTTTRTNAMKSFRRDDNSISQLYISAKLCLSLAFSDVKDFIIVDRLKQEFAVDALYMMFSSWKKEQCSTPLTEPVRMHTVSAPSVKSAQSSNLLSFGIGAVVRNKGPHSLDSILSTLEQIHVWPGIPQLNAGIVPTLPISCIGYKRLLHNVFDLPKPKEKASERPYLIPLSNSPLGTTPPVDEEFIEQVWDLLPEEGEVDFVDLTEDLTATEPHASEINPEWQPPNLPAQEEPSPAQEESVGGGVSFRTVRRAAF